MRGAGGSRTRFCGFADRRPAVRLRRPRCFDPLPEGHVLARNRTWSSTFAGSCARPSHPEDLWKQACCRAPHPGIEPGLAASKTAVRPPHSRGNEPVPSPGVEPGLRPSGGRVPSVTRRGRSRSRRPGSNRHEPAYKAGASPFGHVGGSRGARIRTLCAGFGGPLLSQEHAPVNGPGSCRGGGRFRPVRAPTRRCRVLGGGTRTHNHVVRSDKDTSDRFVAGQGGRRPACSTRFELSLPLV